MCDPQPLPRRSDHGLVHEALFYRGEAQFERGTRQFIEQALDAGEPVLAALPASNLELLRDALSGLSEVVQFEDLTIIGRNPSRILPLVQRWVERHPGRVRMIGEPVWPGRSPPEIVEGLRHEALLNQAFARADATFLCPFDAARLSPEAILGAELTHPWLADADGSRRASTRYAEPAENQLTERWPLSPATAPIAEHPFTGDLGAVRRFVVSDGRMGALEPEQRENLVFAVNEVVTNAVKHGDGHCQVRIWRDDASVIAEVSSRSWVTDTLAGRRVPAVDALRGRGLWLVNQMCDLVELRSDASGTTVRMHMRLALG